MEPTVGLSRVPLAAPPSPPLYADEEITATAPLALSLQPDSDEIFFSQQGTQERAAYLWGTLISPKDTIQRFNTFISSFTKDISEDATPHYIQLLEQAWETQNYSINLDCKNLYDFDRELYQQLINYPQEVIPIFDLVMNEAFQALVGVLAGEEAARNLTKRIEVRPFNLVETKTMRNLNPEDIDKLVCIRGMIIRTSPISPDLRVAHFECVDCHQSETKTVERGRITEPTVCPNCRARNTMALIHNRCIFTDKQYIKLQETPESVPEGATPQTVTLAVHDSLVDVASPGDKVEVTGLYRATPIRPTSTQRTIKQIYKTYIDVVHFRRTERNRLADRAADRPEEAQYQDEDEVESDVKQREAEILALSKRPDIYEILTKAFAPSIWEMDDVKKGVLCLLFGGTQKKFKDAATGKFRSEINILLCGDPGTSKSQILQYVHKIAPRGLYTSGKGSSAVGLTAYITRDPDTGESVLESGALVLSDRGVCCIDEFDKMSEHTRSILHEAMEQQTVSVAKAGIICTLNARTSILASANPRESRYNPMLSVVENIQLPPTLLSRFDLIYLVLDTADEVKDTKLARHIVSLYFKNPPTVSDDDGDGTGKPLISTQLLTQYISYARKHCHPVISDEAVEALVRGYVDMRRRGESSKTITATTRQLESLIRLSEALAKMRLSPTVLPEDVEEAIRLMKIATHRAATDPRTGLIDMDMLTTGYGASHSADIEIIKQRLLDLIRQHGNEPINSERLFTMVSSMSTDREVSREDFNIALASLQDDEQIVMTGERNRLIKKLS